MQSRCKIMKRNIVLLFLSIIIVFSLVFLFLTNRNGVVTVGKSTTFATITTNFQRTTFYANNRHWVFYCNGSHILYTSSSDGSNWMPSTAIRMGISNSGISIWYDGSIHYAYASGEPNNPVIYCRGGISEDRITWEPQRIVTEAEQELKYYNGYCVVDSDGHPFVAYMQYDDTYWAGYVARSISIDGSVWASEKIFESSTPYKTWRLCLLTLEQKRLIAIYTSETSVKAKLWNGTAWGEEEDVTNTDLAQDYGFSAVSHNNNVHLVLLENETYNILYFRRTAGTGWSQNENIEANQDPISLPVLCVDELTANLYCFWIYENEIHMKKRVNGIWEDSTNTFGMSTNTLRGISCYYKVYDGKMGVTWVEKLNAGYFMLMYQFLKTK